MQKLLYKTKRGSFKIEWHKSILLFGFINEPDEIVFVLFQLGFIFQKPTKRSKKRGS